jgi:hypothetical protein
MLAHVKRRLRRQGGFQEEPMIFRLTCARVLAVSILMTLWCGRAMAQTTAPGLIHRYSFNDGTARDSAGKIDGTLKGAAKIADGKLVLDNTDKANGAKTSGDATLSYLEFSGSIIPKSGSATLIVWITAPENQPYCRIMDIGDTDPDTRVGQAFIYLVPHHDTGSKIGITASDTGGKSSVDGDALDDGKPHMAAIVIDGDAKKLHFYIDGKEAGEAADLNDNTLDGVHPVHNYMGRSLSDVDPGLTASIDEFRVYDRALPASEVTAAFKAGPDAFPTDVPATAPTPAPAAGGK